MHKDSPIGSKDFVPTRVTSEVVSGYVGCMFRGLTVQLHIFVLYDILDFFSGNFKTYSNNM